MNDCIYISQSTFELKKPFYSGALASYFIFSYYETDTQYRRHERKVNKHIVEGRATVMTEFIRKSVRCLCFLSI